MEEYPALSLDHNIPLLCTLGIASESSHELDLEPTLKDQAVLIRSELEPVASDQAIELLAYIRERDASAWPWNQRDPARRYKFRVKTAERTFFLPPRRARLPDHIEAPPTPSVLHSPFSPLSPVSPLYPDGMMDTRWLAKHQEYVPSVLLCFYGLTSDATLATLHDNQIKTDLNNIRGLLSQSGYRTRLAVVILAEQTSSPIDGIQERLENIRRGCGLDPKAFFLAPPHESQEELERMAENMLITVYGHALEYYRDLGRHARKKRSRGIAPKPSVPPTSGTSHSLSLAGWNVRYDFKSAVFAEYRQEMDNAMRSYEQAYENLMSSEVFELIPSWSLRWNEARSLADMIAVRHLRCLLWLGQHTSAVRKWQAHHDRIADYVDRLGRGLTNYGWPAWEARWTLVMANLLERAEVAGLSSPGTLFLQPEKAVMGERLQPWENLHHTGYWYRLASRYLNSRRALAYSMPEDDRRDPSASPASRLASKAFTYESYMTPDPHEEYPLNHTGVPHGKLIIDCLLEARRQFLLREQLRLAAEISLECARELAILKDWAKVVDLLEPLWSSQYFRAEGWMNIADDLSWALRTAAAMTGHADLVVATDWELLDQSYTKRPGWHYDISRALESTTVETKPVIKFGDDKLLSFYSASFVFRHEEGKAGQTASAQLSITSKAHRGSVPVVLKSLQIDFNGGIKTVLLNHKSRDAEAKGRVVKSTVSLTKMESSSAEDQPEALDLVEPSLLVGDADLTLSPGQTLVFELDIPLREPGEFKAAMLKSCLRTEKFEFEYTSKFKETMNSNCWFISATGKKRVAHVNPLAVRILPRPPKMDIRDLVLMDEYYTNEPINLEFEVLNAEDVEAMVKIDTLLFGEEPPEFELVLSDGTVYSASTVENDERRLEAVSVGTIENSKSIKVEIRVKPADRPSRYDLTLRVTYDLSTDSQTLITQTGVFFLNVANPFEANYDLLPRLHPDPWPSLFDSDGVQDLSGDDDALDIPKGISQTWCLVTRYASFASEDLKVLDLDIQIQPSPAVRSKTIKRFQLPEGGSQVSPKTIEEAAFDVVAQKQLLEDRAESTLEVSLLIKWYRIPNSRDRAADNADAALSKPPSQATVNTTTLPVPRFNIFGIQPRVLASASYLRRKPGQPRLIVLDVVIENASNHFLTFGVSVEPSDEFALSGAKQTSLNLLPVSRRSVTYRLLPLVARDGPKSAGTWIHPGLVVRDKYFQKVLRVIPTEGMRLDKDGISIFVPPEEEDEEENAPGVKEQAE